MKRVLLIGLDGFSPDLAGKWIEEGRLPRLGALKAAGCFGPLQGVLPPVTFPAWTTCVTGVNPGRHGIVDFTEVVPGRYGLRFLNSTDRKAPALWNILSGAGRRVCVLGVPGTYPPEPVNGILMAGFDSPVADSVAPSFVYPPSAYPIVRGWRFAEFQEHRITPAWYGRALSSLERKIALKESVCLDLYSRERWDFFMVVFGEADTASHHFWPLEDPASPRHEPVHAARLPHPIRRIYERLDEMVGRLADMADNETLVLIVSDHGFGGADIRSLHLNNFLAEHGWLHYARPSRNLLKRAALRCLPVRGRGRLFRRFIRQAERAESQSRFGGIDWSRTRAWSEELDYFPSVRLNLAGREPQGTVDPALYEETANVLCSLLSGLPGIARALPRSEAYQGPYACKAPDILLELAWDTGYRYSCLRTRGGPAVQTIPAARRAGGKEAGCSGVHKNPAVFVSNRPITVQAPSLLDIAPTVLDYLEVPGPEMEGTSLFTAGPREKEANPPEWMSPLEKSYTGEEEQLLEERMRMLGYFE